MTTTSCCYTMDIGHTSPPSHRLGYHSHDHLVCFATTYKSYFAANGRWFFWTTCQNLQQFISQIPARNCGCHQPVHLFACLPSLYSNSLSHTNLQVVFRKSGICPFNPAVINDDVFAPEDMLCKCDEAAVRKHSSSQVGDGDVAQEASQFFQDKMPGPASAEKQHLVDQSSVVGGTAMTEADAADEVEYLNKGKPA